MTILPSQNNGDPNPIDVFLFGFVPTVIIIAGFLAMLGII